MTDDLKPTLLPDGSAFATASFPLPADHWLYAPLAKWDSKRDEFADCPLPILTNAQRDAVKAAARYAIRGATTRGQEMDFDPDALVQNMTYALCGPRPAESCRPPKGTAMLCEHKKLHSGNDETWCEDCGVVTWATDGASVGVPGSDEREKASWRDANLSAWSCASEARGGLGPFAGRRCAAWCHSPRCTVSLRCDMVQAFARTVAASPAVPSVPQGWRLVQSPITEEMHTAACKVLTRASGLDGTPQRMLDAMLAASPQPAQAEPADEVRHYAMRALIAWDGTVLPKAHDGMMQERMEDLRAALEAQAEPAGLTPLERAADAAIAEVEKAMRKFPTWPTDPLHALAVLGEEFGELTKDVLQMVYEPHKTDASKVRTECIQTAAMALRFMASLDRYEYKPGLQHSQGAAIAQAEAAATTGGAV